MRRDIGSEVIVAIAVVGVIAFALMFAIVLSLSNSAPTATILEPTFTLSAEQLAQETAVAVNPTLPPTLTNTSEPPTATPIPPTLTNTPEPPTATPVPPTLTNTPEPPTATPVPPTLTSTPEPPTATFTATEQSVILAVTAATATDVPTETPIVPTATDVPTETPIVPTATNTPELPTATDVPPTLTNTSEPPTATEIPTDVPTATDVPTDVPTETLVVLTATNTVELPTATDVPTDVPTSTPEPPTATDVPTDVPTETLIIPTATDVPTDVPTSTPEPPTEITPTSIFALPTSTEAPTETLVPATATATPTNTSEPPTAAPTSTVEPPTAAPTETVVPATLPPTPAPVSTEVSGEPTPFILPTALMLSGDLLLPTAVRDCPVPAGWVVRAARIADTLQDLAQTVGSTADALRRANCISEGDDLAPGMMVYLPLPATEVVAATATPAPVFPTGTIPAAEGCSSPGVRIITPVAGSVVTGTFVVVGAAAVPDGGLYVVEISAGDSTDYSLFTTSRSPVVGGVLAEINSDDYGDGLYWIRLVVLDAHSSPMQSCAIPVIFR